MALTQVQGGMLAGSTNTTTTIQSNGTTAITIDSSQNVGVGVTPNGRYQLQAGSGTSAAGRGFSLMTVSGGYSGGDYPSIGYNFRSTTTSGSYLYNETDIATQINFSSVGINFNIAASGTSGNAITFAERMRLTASGNLLIGITTPLPNNTGKITTFATAGSTAGWVSKGNSNGYYGALFENQSNTTVGFIQVDASSTNYSTTSDYRLKENIAPMTGALAKVAQLKPCTYTWKIDGSDGQGFIAHELQAVVPDAVSGEKDAVETYTDEDGNEQTRIKPQGVDTSFLVATLTAAIQELKAELDATKAEVAALKAAP
jgi:hypothetical protein